MSTPDDVAVAERDERIAKIRERAASNTGPRFGYTHQLTQDIDYLLSSLAAARAELEEHYQQLDVELAQRRAGALIPDGWEMVDIADGAWNFYVFGPPATVCYPSTTEQFKTFVQSIRAEVRQEVLDTAIRAVESQFIETIPEHLDEVAYKVGFWSAKHKGIQALEAAKRDEVEGEK